MPGATQFLGAMDAGDPKSSVGLFSGRLYVVAEQRLLVANVELAVGDDLM